MKDRQFREGTVIKGKDLKGYMLCRILPEDMEMDGFKHRLGMNERVGPSSMKGDCRSGLQFYPAGDICNYLGDGEKLALVSIPDDEDVRAGHGWLSADRMVIEKVLLLNEVLGSAAGWECLILNGADITAHDNHAVRWAAENGHLEAVRFLHENGADITACGNYAVRWAARNGHLETVEYLHEQGADITAGNNFALRCAARQGHTEVVEYLHENGASIMAGDNEAVRYAAENGHLEVVKYLHENGADIKAWDNYALRWAAERGHLEVVKYLHESGADIMAGGGYAVIAAEECGHTDVAEYLRRGLS